MPLLWILLYHLIDQGLQESEPRESGCPRRRRPLGRGLKPRPSWTIVDPLHNRGQKTLSEEEIIKKRADEEQRARIKSAKRTLTVIAWTALTVAVFYFVYVRPLIFPGAYRFWFSFPELEEFNPESIREFASSTLGFTLNMMIFFLPILFMFMWMGSIMKGWEEDDRFEK